MEHIIPEIDKKGLREFGIVTGLIVAILFGVIFPWLLNTSSPIWPWTIASILIVWALLAPATMASLYRGWMRCV